MNVKLCVQSLVLIFSYFLELTVCDPCSEHRHSIIDDYRRSPNSYYDLSEQRLCDNRIRQGWYRLKVNGTDAQVPTQCVQKGCGTRAPIWLKPPSNGLPSPGRKARTHACASFNVPGSDVKCCGVKFPITVKNCGTYFVYRLRSTKGCDLAYCTEEINKGCGVDQVYVLHLQKCVDIKVQISKPKLHVKQSPDQVSIVCLFDVNNITVSQHKPSFLLTWIRMRSGVSSVIRFKFITNKRDQIVLGKDVYTGDTVACEVMPVHQTQSQVSESLFLGIQVMETGIAVYENSSPVTLTFVSTVPLICGKDSCNLEMVLTVQYPRGANVSNIALSRCILQFQPDNRCQGTGCVTQQITVAMTPNLHLYKFKEVTLSGYIYVDDHVQWNQATVQSKIKVIDLPSASCYVTAGIYIMSFQQSISKLSRRGTYVLVKSKDSELEVHVRVNSCTSENLLCVCGFMVYYQQTKLMVDKCNHDNQRNDISVQYRHLTRTNVKIYEGRNGKLIYFILDSKGQIRIDLRQKSMSLTIQLSGYYSDRMDGLCGHIGNDTQLSNNIALQGSWRLLPGQSLFQKSSQQSVTMATNHPECDCSLSSYETSCPKSPTRLPQFLFQLKDTTFYWLNKTKKSNQIQDYVFDGDFDDEEVITKQPSKDGQLASDNCRLMFMTSGIAKTCLNKIEINIETVINICVALATSYRNSTWMPEVLRLLENLCETHLSDNGNSLASSNMKTIDIEDIRQAILCPEGCYGNGLCTESGCFCYHGYTGIECLTKTEKTTTTSMATSSNRTTVSTTTASTTTSTTTKLLTTLSTISTSLATEKLVTMVTCDTRTMRCSTVHVNLMYSDRGFPYQCLVSLVQLTETGWEATSEVFNTMLRYVDMATVECMLPMVTDKDSFPTVYQVQVPSMSGHVITSQLVAVYDSLCQKCDIVNGCILKSNTCFINRNCYEDGTVNSENYCQKCESTKTNQTWSSIDNTPPVLEPSEATITAIPGDTVKVNIRATDNKDLIYTMDYPHGSINPNGEFTWAVIHSSMAMSEEERKFFIKVTDGCGAATTYILTVLIKSCGCLNGGQCDTQVVTSNRTGFTCQCQPSFTGILCDTRIEGCHSNPCFPGVLCTEISGSYTCGSCLDGYQGDGVTCVKTCSADPCFHGVTCTDHPRLGYVCGACPQYYYGNGEQCYRNNDKACDQGVCSPLVTCNETSEYPGYGCGNCPHGYIGNGTFCKAFCFPPCTGGTECMGNGVCKCRHGYKGPGCTEAVCQEPCRNGGICYQPDKCFCQLGFTGEFCETDLCPEGCLNGGSCLAENTCACLPGYRGHRCQIESCSISCLNGGTCVGFNRCQCTSQFTGTFCEQAICVPDCLNGGVCVRPDVCYCPMGFYGGRCEKVFCYPPCESGGYCMTGNKCLCRPGYTGAHCQHKHCFKTQCRNGGKCVGPELCACRAGWEGQNCGRPICHLGCQNGGYCYLPDRCRCPSNYWGPNCQFPSCFPPCGFGSICTGPNQCKCRKEYTGKYCRKRRK